MNNRPPYLCRSRPKVETPAPRQPPLVVGVLGDVDILAGILDGGVNGPHVAEGLLLGDAQEHFDEGKRHRGCQLSVVTFSNSNIWCPSCGRREGHIQKG